MFQAQGHISEIQGNNFKIASPNIATTSKAGQKTVNLQNIFMNVLI